MGLKKNQKRRNHYAYTGTYKGIKVGTYTNKKEEKNMTLDEFYKIYKLHREYSIPPVEGAPSFESEVYLYIGKMEKALRKDYNLCLDVFSSFDLDFFLWFTEEYVEWFEDVLSKHLRIELLDTLKNHVYSFNDENSKIKVDAICEKMQKDCK